VSPWGSFPLYDKILYKKGIMKKRGPIFSFLVIVFSMSIGINCALRTDEMKNQDTSDPVIFTEEDNGGYVKIKQGRFFDIILEGNPTTGYSWEKVEPEDDQIVELLDTEYTPESDRVGSAGIKVFHFKTIGKGKAFIRLIYRRSWEKEVQPIREFELKITVK
jgi:inhibitor of cysteine peptidase